mgnify:CR=1 FL=1
MDMYFIFEPIPLIWVKFFSFFFEGGGRKKERKDLCENFFSKTEILTQRKIFYFSTFREELKEDIPASKTASKSYKQVTSAQKFVRLSFL